MLFHISCAMTSFSAGCAIASWIRSSTVCVAQPINGTDTCWAVDKPIMYKLKSYGRMQNSSNPELAMMSEIAKNGCVSPTTSALLPTLCPVVEATCAMSDNACYMQANERSMSPPTGPSPARSPHQTSSFTTTAAASPWPATTRRARYAWLAAEGLSLAPAADVCGSHWKASALHMQQNLGTPCQRSTPGLVRSMLNWC